MMGYSKILPQLSIYGNRLLLTYFKKRCRRQDTVHSLEPPKDIAMRNSYIQNTFASVVWMQWRQTLLRCIMKIIVHCGLASVQTTQYLAGLHGI